jgi:hypothetical protein
VTAVKHKLTRLHDDFFRCSGTHNRSGQLRSHVIGSRRSICHVINSNIVLILFGKASSVFEGFGTLEKK